MDLFSSPIQTLLNPALSVPGGAGPYRPVTWSQSGNSVPALTMTVSGSGSNNQTTAYVFDTALDIRHEQDGVITINPVQTGTALNDHFYVTPVRVTAEILMSDSVQSFTVGQFASGPSRSVAAFNLLMSLQSSRTLVSIATRLNMYSNMMIASVRGNEDHETRYGARFTVTFQQILTASVEQVQPTFNTNFTYDPNADSTRPQTTSSTLIGQTPPNPVPPAIQQQHNITNAPPSAGLSSVPSVAGAGAWSSYPVNSGGPF